MTLDVYDLLFFFFSVILSEWRGRQRNPRCLTHPRCVPNSLYLYILLNFVCLYLSLWPPPLLCCRILRPQMNLPPSTHRMTTPQMRRSWPPPPVISLGRQLCMTWMQIWTQTNKTFPSHATLHPLLMRTVFLIRLQVRLSFYGSLGSFFVPPATCVQIKANRDQSIPQTGSARRKFKACVWINHHV